MPDVVIKKSKIQGKGVFAGRNFKKGEVVLKWKLKVLSKTDVDRLAKRQKHYLYKFGGKFYLQQSPEKFVNHSCDPNTKTKGFSDIAIKNIKKGEEITSKYTKASLPVGFKCRCGNKSCIKTIK